MVEELYYKPEDRGFESQSGNSMFFFNLHNPSNRNMALEFTQPLTEMSTRRFFGGKARWASKAYNHTVICESLA
jgi:hypothetical protein